MKLIHNRRMKCLFCKIIQKEIPGDIIFEDEQVIVLRDIQPQAPIHCLVIPKKHIATINDTEEKEALLLGHMIHIAKKVAHQENIAEVGYRLVFNVNEGGGQAVFHIHLHILGGRALHWPPG